ncbi:MAG: SDR family NAD(P)-dependent oxidoreductase [Planctomycetota bacterium]
MPTVVTGAGGFIGSHLVERLVQRARTVTALVRYTSDGGIGHLARLSAETMDRVSVIRGDVRDLEQMRRIIGTADGVLHLAALIGIPYSYDAPRSYIDTNVLGTLNVLEAARQHGNTMRVIVTSTSEVYGTAQTVPITEDHRLHPQSPYAASKVGADQLALSYHRSFGMPVVLARPFNTFGPRQSLRAVIPTIIAQLLGRDDGIVELGALSPRRDFVFVEDTAEALCELLDAPRDAGVEGREFNIATGASQSIEETARLAAELVGKPETRLVCANERVRPAASEVEVLEGDATRLREAIGWAPRVPLREGLQRMIDWFRERQPQQDVRGYHV